MRRLAVLILALVACSYDRAQYQGSDHPAVKDAYRIHSAEPDCVRIGRVSVAGLSEPLPAMAETAARHGGTHYVVDGDETETVGYHTSGQVIGNGVYVGRTTPIRERSVSAVVYRCSK